MTVTGTPIESVEGRTYYVADIYERAAAGKLEVHRLIVTPELAQRWLARRGVNRHLSESRVRNMAAAIKRGEWQVTGETIKLAPDGTLRDGQHRLSAVVLADMPVETFVAFNVTEPAFDVIDTGKSRNLADVITLHDYPYATAIAAAARIRVVWERDISEAPDPAAINAVTAPQVLAYLAVHGDRMKDAIAQADSLRKAGLGGGTGLWAAVLIQLAQIDPVDEDAFVEALRSGANLAPGSPLLALRNRATSKSGGSWGTHRRQELMALIIKGWNYWRDGRDAQMLVWRRGGSAHESFPIAA